MSLKTSHLMNLKQVKKLLIITHMRNIYKQNKKRNNKIMIFKHIKIRMPTITIWINNNINIY